MATAAEHKIVYPTTKREVVSEEYHGEKVEDPYRWLEDPDSKDTQAWVDSQNVITNEFLSEIPYRESIRKRLEEMQDYVKMSCPFKRGSRYFFFKNEGLQNQSVLYKQETLEAKAEVLLDPNALATDGTAALGAYEFSEDGKLLAYAISRSGSDWQTIYVRDVSTSSDLSDRLEWVKFSSISWSHDNLGFFYSRYPTPEAFKGADDQDFKRGSETQAVTNQTVYFHRVGTPQEQDVLIFANPENPKWMTSAEVSDDGDYLLLSISDSCDPVNRLFYAPMTAVQTRLSDPSKDLEVVKLVDVFESGYSYVTNFGSVFYFRTNRSAPKYRVIAIDLRQPASENWQEVIAESADVLQAVSCVNLGTQLIVSYLQHVKDVLKLFGLPNPTAGASDVRAIPVDFTFPTPDVGSVPSWTGRRNQTEVFYKFTSFLYPGTIFHVDLKERTTKLWFETKVKGFNPSEFKTQQIFYPSKDGTSIPMFLVHRADLQLDGANPTLLYGYGGFNISLSPSFSVSRLIFVQNFKGIYALANLRGGGEYGDEWHKAGTVHRKQNVFDDFIAAAEHLIKEKFTQPSKIAIQGGSNGGLLVCACANQRPDLFGAVLGHVGVLDMLRFHKFTIGYAWCSDYGCSDNKEQYATLKKYSPVHNVAEGVAYPAVLLCAADHDDRVVPLHSYKYISQLQHVAGSQAYQKQPLLIRVDVKAGHGAGKPLSKQNEETADVMAFAARNIGVEPTF